MKPWLAPSAHQNDRTQFNQKKDVDLMAQRPKPTFETTSIWARFQSLVEHIFRKAITKGSLPKQFHRERNSESLIEIGAMQIQIHCIPQCTHAIHSTRAQNLSSVTTVHSRRNSGVRRQRAVSGDCYSHSIHLKPSLLPTKEKDAPPRRAAHLFASKRWESFI